MSNEKEYLDRSHQVLIHNVGYHDLFCDLYTEDDRHLGWHRPKSMINYIGSQLLEPSQQSKEFFKIIKMKKGGGAFSFTEDILVETGITASKPMGNWKWAETPQRESDKHCSPLMLEDLDKLKKVKIKRLMIPLIDGLLHKFENSIYKWKNLHLVLVSSGELNHDSSTHKLTKVLANLTRLGYQDKLSNNTKEKKSFTLSHKEIFYNPHEVMPSTLLPVEKEIRTQATELAINLESEQNKQVEELNKQIIQKKISTQKISRKHGELCTNCAITLANLEDIEKEAAEKLSHSPKTKHQTPAQINSESKTECPTCNPPVVTVNREDWIKCLGVHLSANTGTANMITALTLALAEWSPMMHFIDAARKPLSSTPEKPANKYNAHLKRVEAVSEWIKVDEDHIETQPLVQKAVLELRAWAAQYKKERPLRPRELEDTNELLFWHRKGLKEVLCVVLVENPSNRNHTSEKEYIDSLEVVRGVNVEVSLPTGTLCAERNAISTAFCKFPKLERKDIKAVAVLSLDHKLSKLGPCGACQEWLKKVLEVNPDLRVISFSNPAAEEAFLRPALLI